MREHQQSREQLHRRHAPPGHQPGQQPGQAKPGAGGCQAPIIAAPRATPGLLLPPPPGINNKQMDYTFNLKRCKLIYIQIKILLHIFFYKFIC